MFRSTRKSLTTFLGNLVDFLYSLGGEITVKGTKGTTVKFIFQGLHMTHVILT